MKTLVQVITAAALGGWDMSGDGRRPVDDSALLEPPFIVMGDGQPIDVDVGHAAPILADCDGDGVRELLVGQFGSGLLRMYPDVSEVEGGAPEFEDFFWVESNSQKLAVPSG